MQSVHDENAIPSDENAIIKHHPWLRTSRKSNHLDHENPRSSYRSKVATVPHQASASFLSRHLLGSHEGCHVGVTTRRVPLSEIAPSAQDKGRQEGVAGTAVHVAKVERFQGGPAGEAILQTLMHRVDVSQYERLRWLAHLNGTLVDGLHALQVC